LPAVFVCFPTPVAASVLNAVTVLTNPAIRPTPTRNRRSKIHRRPTNADIQSIAIYQLSHCRRHSGDEHQHSGNRLRLVNQCHLRPNNRHLPSSNARKHWRNPQLPPRNRLAPPGNGRKPWIFDNSRLTHPQKPSIFGRPPQQKSANKESTPKGGAT
jgi:hypothetical protein